MSTSFRNSSFNNNFNRETLAVLPSELDGDTIEIQFPTQLIGAVDFRNNPTSTIDSSASSKKSLAQSMFNSRKNNTIYIEQPSITASTSNRLDKVYFKPVVDNDVKAKYVAQAWREIYNKSEMKAKDVSRENNGNFEQGNTKEVDRYFEKAKAAMTGPSRKQEKFKRPNYDQENDHVGVQNIHRGAVGETGILNNRANIRTVMGNRSMENQERIQAEKAAKAKLLALHEAKRANIERQEEVKGVKFADAQNLSNSWKIPNTDKLKKVVQSESIKGKNAAKEEARKNSKKTTQNTLTRKSTKTDMEASRASSAPKKNQQQTTEEDKKYVFSAKKIKKLPTESQADYKTRVNYTLMALPQQKENLDPVEQHQITKKFHELILKSGVEKNGRITLDAKK